MKGNFYFLPNFVLYLKIKLIFLLIVFDMDNKSGLKSNNVTKIKILLHLKLINEALIKVLKVSNIV